MKAFKTSRSSQASNFHAEPKTVELETHASDVSLLILLTYSFILLYISPCFHAENTVIDVIYDVIYVIIYVIEGFFRFPFKGFNNKFRSQT